MVEMLVEPCRRRLVLESDQVDRYVFAPALIRQTLEEELPAGRRARLHRAAADAIEEIAPDAHADIARHLVAAGPVGDPERALHHAKDAAEAASEQRAWEDAASWYERALDLDGLIASNDPTRRARLLISLGLAKNAMGNEFRARADFVAAADLARSAGDALLFADAVCSYGGRLGVLVDPGDSVGGPLLDEALSLLPRTPTAMRAALLAQRSLWETLAVDLADARRFASEALAIARDAADSETQILALRALTWSRLQGPHATEITPLDDELETLARLSGNVSHLGIALLQRAYLYAQAGDFRAMEAVVLKVQRLARDVGDVTMALPPAACLNLLDITAGRFDAAIASLDAHRRAARSAVEEIIDLVQRFLIAEICEDAVTYTRLVKAADKDHSGFFSLFPLWRDRLTARHDVAGTQCRLREWAVEIRPKVPAVYAAATDANACRLLADVSEPSVAAGCYRRLSPMAESWPFSGPGSLRGVGHHSLGLAARAMGRLDDSADHLRRGLVLHEASGLPVFIAESHIELARTLVVRDGPGDRDAARPHLDQAGSIARERGFRRVERLVGEVRAAMS
ncbi:MAG: hypothetical protein NVS3B1_26500 [Marmoricola sp.]